MAKKKIIALFIMAALLVTAALPVLVACNDKADVTGKGVERPENIFTDDIDTVDADNLAAGARKTTQIMSAPSESDALSNDVMRAPSGARFNFRHLVIRLIILITRMPDRNISRHSYSRASTRCSRFLWVFPRGAAFAHLNCRMSARYIRTK